MKTHLIFYSLIIVSALAAASCNSFFQTEDEEYCADYDYSDCDTREPSSAHVTFRLSEVSSDYLIPVKVYKGNFEEGSVVFEKDIAGESFTVALPVNETYSATAIYESDGKTITVLEGTTLTKNSETKCDSTCWSVSGTSVDLRLKLYKSPN